jgi:hypothetical protein
MVFAATWSVAGVVYEIENRQTSPETVQNSEISVEGSWLKMTIDENTGEFDGEMIFRGDRREMVIVNHKEKTYTVLDEATMEKLAQQMEKAMAAMAEMERALANVPESQRARVEEMMKSRLPNMGKPPEPTELRKTGDTDTLRGYPCVRYEILRGGIRLREMWVTDWANVEGGSDAAAAFQGMAEFFQEMIESLPKFGTMGGGSATAAFEHMRDMNGFPVVSREFADDGSLQSMGLLISATPADLGPENFEPNPKYKRQKISMQ